MNEFKIGIIGCGSLTRQFYLPVLKKIGYSSIVLIDPATESVSRLAKEYSLHKISDSVEEALPDFDAAIIASPNFLHVPQALLLLQHGKHVLLEKPIASTQAEVERLMQTAKQSGALLQPAMMRRFWKINIAVKKLLQEEVLGKLQSVSMQEGDVLNWPVQSDAIFRKEQSLGGVFFDTGSHTLDLLCWWIGDQQAVLRYQDDNRGGVETEAHLEVQFLKSDIRASVRLSRIRKMPNEYLLQGTKGWIKLKPYGNIFETSDRKTDQFIFNQYSKQELRQQSFEDIFSEQVTCWLSAMEKKELPVVQTESVLPSIRMIETAYKSRTEINYAWC